MESETLSSTMESFEGRAAGRHRQLASLRSQAKTAEAIVEEHREALAEAEARLVQLSAGTGAARRLFEARLEQRRDTVEELHQQLCARRRDACEAQELILQQRTYMRQLEQVIQYGGRAAVARHRAGHLALAERPPPVGDVPQASDIGTSVANPYVVDSWPFEPNVLARRASTEASMQTLVEESALDIENERLRLPHRCIGPPVRLDGAESDGSEELDLGVGCGDDDVPGRPRRRLGRHG